MLTETYKPRKGFVLVELTILRPKEEKATFIDTSKNKDAIKEGDIPAYKVLGTADGSDLKTGDFVQLVADIKTPGMFGNLVPEDTVIATVTYEGLEDYIIKSYKELVEEHEQTR